MIQQNSEYIFLGEKKFIGEKMKVLFVADLFFKVLPKLSDFVNSDGFIGKNHIKIYQTASSFYSKKNLIFSKINLCIQPKHA